MIRWDDELIQAIGRRRSVIVIGSGVSLNSKNAMGKRPASWRTFLENAAKGTDAQELIERLVKERDYLTACEIIQHKLSRDRFAQLVQQEYQQAGYHPAEIHAHIYNLDSSIVASPNFDGIYENYAQTTSAGTMVVRDHTQTDTINYLGGGDTRLILKTHGNANNPGHLIFTRAEYAASRTKHVLYYEIMKSLILTHTFLFLGCGLDDPDIRMQLEDVQFAHERMPFHYMTIPFDEYQEDIARVVRETMRIKLYPYSPTDGHQELTQSLGELVTQVDAFRQTKSQDQKW